MKKQYALFILILAIMAGINITALAQPNQDKPDNIYINKKGGIYNREGGTKLGFIDKDDIVRSNDGKELYFIDKNGNVIGADGKKLGIAKKNGSYYNVNGENVLNTKDLDKERCAILDPEGHNIGIIHKNYKQHACAIHCFFLEQKKEKEEKSKHN
ncbi:MAG: hypothetical protein JWP44_2984 [Mucilaginibacter sp.]|nr:hypothetical protein [Mucilaginibacter sp.]